MLVIHSLLYYAKLLVDAVLFPQLLGSNHPDVAKQFTNLAILCSHLGKYDEVCGVLCVCVRACACACVRACVRVLCECVYCVSVCTVCVCVYCVSVCTV